jgi:YVTN family beta-propeller protein
MKIGNYRFLLTVVIAFTLLIGGSLSLHAYSRGTAGEVLSESTNSISPEASQAGEQNQAGDGLLQLSSPGVISTIKVGEGGYSACIAAVNTVTNLVYVTNDSSGKVLVIDGATNNVAASISSPGWPQGVAVNSLTNRIYVANTLGGNVTVIDGESQSVITAVTVGHYPFRLRVNESTNRVYVANYFSNSVSVIDGASNSVIDTVTVGDTPSGIGINSKTNRIYVTNDGTSDVSVIDGAINEVVATVGVGNEPGDVDVNPETGFVYVANYEDNSVTVIDGSDNTVETTVNVESSPRGVAVNSTTNLVYVTNSGSDSVSVIDGSDNSLKNTQIDVGRKPFGLGVNSVTNRLYAANYGGNSVSVIDCNSNTVTATVIMGSGPDAVVVNSATGLVYAAGYRSNKVAVFDGTAGNLSPMVNVGSQPSGAGVNTSTNRIYISNNGSNTLSVINGESNSVEATLEVGNNPLGVGVNSSTNLVYVANNADNTLSVIDGSTGTAVTTLNTGSQPTGVAVNQAANCIYVTNNGSRSVSIIDGNTNTELTTVDVGKAPYGIAVNPATNLIYVANNMSNSVSVIDGEDRILVKTIKVGSSPRGIALNVQTNRIYVANNGSDTVSVIDGASGVVVAVIEAGTGPRGVAVNPETNSIFVTNYLGDTVSVIFDNGLNEAAVAIASSDNSVPFSQPVTFTAAVSPLVEGLDIPTGTATFYSGTEELKTVELDAAGQAQITTSSLTAGSHSITAKYSGDDDFQSGTSPELEQVITAIATTTKLVSSQNPSNLDQMVTFTATVSAVVEVPGKPTGMVVFRNGISAVEFELNASGQAQYMTSNLSLGNHTITAEYSGDGNFLSSTSPELEQGVKSDSPQIITSTISPAAGENKIAYTSQALQAVWGTYPYSWAITAGKLPGGLSLDKNTGVISGKPSKAGTYIFSVTVTDSEGLTCSREFTLTIYSTPSITTKSLTNAMVSRPYSQTLAASYGDCAYTWQRLSGDLPGGLSLDESTGAISGTPTDQITKTTTYKCKYQVTDGLGGKATRSISLKLVPDLAITTGVGLPDTEVGLKYSQVLKAGGGSNSYTWSYENLPSGLTLSTKGALKGTATTPGTLVFTVRVSDGTYSTSGEFSLQVFAALQIITPALAEGTVGQPYTYTPAVSGGDGNYSWKIIGSLPSGLTMDKATGVISGTPAKTGSKSFKVKVTDGLKATVTTLKLSITIK